MSRFKISAFMTVAMLAVGLTAWSQPPEDGPRGRGPGRPGGQGGPTQRKQGMPQSKFKVGTVIPPHVREEMELTKDQEDKIKDLEAEVKSKLEKILKKDQLEMFGRLPMMGGPGGPGFGGPGGRGPGGPGGPPPGGFDGPPPGGRGRGPEGGPPPEARKKGGGQRKGAQPKRPGPPPEDN